MIALDQAQQFVLESLKALAPTEVAIDDALGCVVAEPLIAKEPVPSFKNSSMDGFALRAADTNSEPVRLRVVASIFAGDAPDFELNAGEAARIMTGAPLPRGADSVCMIEETAVDADGGYVSIGRAIAEGEFVRHPGDDVTVGQVLVSARSELGATQIGVLASQGVRSVMVYPRPRVGVLSTGNELTNPDEELTFAKIRDVNRPMLLALLQQSGFVPIDLGIARDTESEINERLMRGARECDAVIATGGVSVGDVDFVKTVLAKICGDSARWMQVAMRPGKPFAFGVTGPDALPIFGLPGNPVSTRVSFEMFVRPALRLLGGHQKLERTVINMVLDVDLARQRDGKLHLVHVVSRVHDDGRMHIENASRHGSHLLSAVADANALAMVPDGEGLTKGEIARAVILESGLRDMAPLRTFEPAEVPREPQVR